nr:ABC transporter ATP-binding protein [Falsarthrobacter nasiphocae]
MPLEAAGTGAARPAVALRDARLDYGGRTVWSGLDLEVQPGEFVAVLGANGSGKTSLLHVLLGLTRLTSGRAEVGGEPVTRGSRRIGYIPQQRLFPPETPLRGRDLVRQGLDGHRWGPGLRPGRTRQRVDELLERVEAAHVADEPVGLLSGGEQQRLRAAQALASSPDVLLCDEPLLSLDLKHQQGISDLIAAQARRGTAVLFVTHEINPIIHHVDRVLYLANGRHSVGAPDDVLRSEVLSSLYGRPVEVVRVGGRVLVAGGEDAHHIEEGAL